MASSKKRRKDLKYARGSAATPARVRDGDRRRRGAIRVEDAIARKRWLQQGGDPMPPPDDPS